MTEVQGTWQSYLWNEYRAYSIGEFESNIGIGKVLARRSRGLSASVANRLPQTLLSNPRHHCPLYPVGSLQTLASSPTDMEAVQKIYARVGDPDISRKLPVLTESVKSAHDIDLTVQLSGIAAFGAHLRSINAHSMTFEGLELDCLPWIEVSEVLEHVHQGQQNRYQLNIESGVLDWSSNVRHTLYVVNEVWYARYCRISGNIAIDGGGNATIPTPKGSVQFEGTLKVEETYSKEVGDGLLRFPIACRALIVKFSPQGAFRKLEVPPVAGTAMTVDSVTWLCAKGNDVDYDEEEEGEEHLSQEPPELALVAYEEQEMEFEDEGFPIIYRQ